ncbi:MAG: hypothetical protein A3E82_05095 [Gammaproteobacteria bacterium RIFCSPHIGHO2_12_FULL_38_11]|nr:MAG: hypothetical protein A3E82_05095 [Gammaproteobacteria bacterium RIFCSPHIGHO2_12_FULL_38_11]
MKATRNGTKITLFGTNGKPQEVIEVTGYQDRTSALIKRYPDQNVQKLIVLAEKEAVSQAVTRQYGS